MSSAIEAIPGYYLPPEYPRNGTSNGLVASWVAAQGPCRLFGFSGYNSKASAQFILVFDSGDVPSASDVAVIVLTVPTVSNFSAYWGSAGRWFSRGIFICNSSTEPSLTAGSADCFFDVQYI